MSVVRHVVRRAAVASVTLDRLDEAREETREDVARTAVRQWERKKQHAARRKAQDLEQDPAGVVAELEASAFGCGCFKVAAWLSASSKRGSPTISAAVPVAAIARRNSRRVAAASARLCQCCRDEFFIVQSSGSLQEPDREPRITRTCVNKWDESPLRPIVSPSVVSVESVVGLFF